MTPEMSQALWDGNINKLDELAPCGCCCHEHTFEDCPARQWFGCRGQYTMTRTEQESWIRHYNSAHGMSREQFLSGDNHE